MQKTDGRDIVWPEVFCIFDKVNITLKNGKNYLLTRGNIAWPRNSIDAINVNKTNKARNFQTYRVVESIVGRPLRVEFYDYQGLYHQIVTESPIGKIMLFEKKEEAKMSKAGFENYTEFFLRTALEPSLIQNLSEKYHLCCFLLNGSAFAVSGARANIKDFYSRLHKLGAYLNG